MSRDRAVLLDRDGTIIKDVGHLTDVDQVELLPGAMETIKAINDAGWLIIIVTNQSVVGRGLCTNKDVEKIHNTIIGMALASDAYINGFIWCPHLPEDDCFCRKPRPGLLYRAAAAYHLDLRECIMIGDQMTDMLAAKAVLCNWYKVKSDVGLAGFDVARLEKVKERKVGLT